MADEELNEGQAVNAAGEVVELDEETGEWKTVEEGDPTDATGETFQRAPEGETVVEEGEGERRVKE